MSEVYRNSAQFVHLDIYGDVADTTPTVAVVKGEVSTPLTVDGPTAIVGGGQRWTTNVGFAHTQDVGELKVVWNFAIDTVASTKTDYLDVVVPLVEIGTARDELEIPANITDEKIALTERRVRRVIESVTSQVFAPVTDTLLATELPGGDVRLPQRLISMTSIGGTSQGLYYVLADGGWALAIAYPRKRDSFRASGVEPYNGPVPIADPFAKYRAPAYTKIEVTGVWGYERVPQDVEEAALILMEQHLCPESLYAERFIKSMTAADMRFEFNVGAYVGTGNVVADRILVKYTPHVMAVI